MKGLAWKHLAWKWRAVGRLGVRRRFAVRLAVAAWMAAGGMAASETAAAQVVQETAEVILVEVPVHVTTREGQPVRGLTAADFELLDRGQKRSLSGLDVVDLEALPEGSAQGPAAAGRRRFLLCFDVAFSRPESLLEARRAARDFVLEGLHASDLAAVMILTLQKGPEFLVSFTSDRAQLVRAIESLGAPRRLGPARIDDPLRLLIEAPKAGPALGTQSLLGEESPRNDARNAEVLAHLRALDRQFERGRRSIERGRVSDWTHALEQLATALASLGGSKRLLYFSEGADAQLVPAAPAEAAAAEAVRESLEIERGERWLRDASDVQGETSLRRQLRTVIRSFQRAGVPVDAIDIGGLSTAPGEGRRQRRTVLSTLARGTGGDLYDGTNDLSRLLGRVLSSTTVTYVLRFQPTDVVPDGSFHVLQVRLKQQMRLTPSRDLIVTHRQGYYAPRPFAALHPLEKSLLAGEAVITAEPRQDLAVDLLVAPFRAGPEGYYLPVILEIDGADLLREPPGAAPRSHLQAEIFAYVTDEQGAIRDFFNRSTNLELAALRSRLRASGLKVYGDLELAAGRYLVRALVRDGDTGRVTVRSAALDLPTTTATEPRLLPPFFVEPPRSWVLLREARAESSSGEVVYPFTLRDHPFVPALRPILRVDQPADLLLVSYALGEGPLNVAGRVYTPDGTALPGEHLELIERFADDTSDRVDLLARFVPHDLALGSYRLEITVDNPGSSRRAASSIEIDIRGQDAALSSSRPN